MKKPLRKVKKFRFQLLQAWICEHFEPCRVADIGGGKGLLAFLLNQNGFKATVIDPFDQVLPLKYKDLDKKRFKIAADMSVPRIATAFDKAMAKDFDLLVGLHAHGSNMKIIEAAKEYSKAFVLLPCCVIGEPISIKPDVDWFASLEDHAHSLGIKTERFELNVSGQGKGFYSV